MPLLPFLILVILLGMLTYSVIKRSVASVTSTPAWLLWFVLMIPVFVMSAWLIVKGSADPPLPLIYGLFVICPLLYAWLLFLGRLPASPPSSNPAGHPPHAAKPLPSPGVTTPAEAQPLGKPMTRDEESLLQKCFPWSIYYLQNIEYRAQMLICKGQLKATPGVAYQTVQQNIHQEFGDRFLVMFQEGNNGKPFFALVPNPQSKTNDLPLPDQGAKRAAKLTKPGLALTLLGTTLMTTTFAGLSYIGGYTPDMLERNPALLWQGIAYGFTLMLILGTHEMGHYVLARRYRIPTTLPYFIPVPFFLGTFGAFIQIKAPVPHRRALFDVGIAGPLAGLVITLPILWWGLAHSQVVPWVETASLLNFDALDPRGSVLLALLSKLTLGDQLTPEAVIDLHPVAVAGCLGLVVTALNLMPVGQLDGGHIVHAMYGQRTGALIGKISRFLVLFLALIHPEFLMWAILLFFIPAVDEPALNDVSELDNRRDLIGLMAMVLLILIVLPVPTALTQALF
jgi:membrane-associated protease RseP (regulator of RpoE activity)